MSFLEDRSKSDWQSLDSEHYLHPFTDHKDLGNKSRIIAKADGVYVYDIEGNQILDGMSGLWCVNIGYGRSELSEAAATQLNELPYYNSFFQCANPPSIELANKLDKITQKQFNKVFYTGSGSESIDTMIRIVRRYWEVMGHPNKKTIIARKNAYHGSTIAGVSLGGMNAMHKQGGPLLPGIEHVDQPYWFESDRSHSPDDFGKKVASQLEEKILEIGVDNIAAFVGEPIQGAGGVIIPPDSYWPEIQRICNHYGILMVTDEVICGFGRLGEWFGADHFQVKPDLMTFAKGVTSGYLPLGGVMVSEKVSSAIIDKGGEFAHGFTYSGHPASCAVAIENIRILDEENLVSRTKNEIGPYLQNKWKSLEDHPIVGETRMVGLMGAMELVPQKHSPQRFDDKSTAGMTFRNFAVNNGLVMRAVGDTIVTSPPLVISEEEVDELVEKAWMCLDHTQSEMTK